MKNLEKLYPIQTGKNNTILRTMSKKVENIDDEIRIFGDELMELMEIYDGAGLAAPQIGKNIRMIATTQWKITKNESKIIGSTLMINPNIINKSEELVVSEEACLSIPNFIGKVKRHKSLIVEYFDIKGKKYKKKFKDLNSFIIQHEYDHLDGILFTDKLIGKNSGKKKDIS